jgi:serine/threonine protein kinase/tetratricopeptide (TPR) repeat protein
MIGKTVSHYTILEKLGEGGMGVVYKAEDTRLKRPVALKFLPYEFTRDQAAKSRFIQEARAASALDHPNICNIHDIDETSDGQTFIAMACYDGETLRERIERGPLPVKEALNISMQIVQGLEKVHSRKIVHRDIKPGNIFITREGVVKIFDFGLAKLSNLTRLTKDGKTPGTVAYMSPEQIRGENLNSRTDIWSLGATIYEMITGRKPFQGEYEQAVIYSILNETPEPVTGLRTGIPMALEQLVGKALSKKPDERYQHVDEIRVDLNRIQQQVSAPRGAADLISPKRRLFRKLAIPLSVFLIFLCAIYTLPRIGRIPGLFKRGVSSGARILIMFCENLDDPDDKKRYGEIITDALCTDLIESSDLPVMSLQQLYDVLRREGLGEQKNISRWLQLGGARKAGAGILITPSLSRRDSELVLRANIIDVKSGDIKGSPEVQGDDTNIYALVDSMSLKLRMLLLPQDLESEKYDPPIREVTTKSTEAYAHYLEAEELAAKYDFLESIEAFKKAVSLDSTFATAYSRMAWAYHFINLEEEATKAIESAFRNMEHLKEREKFYVRFERARGDWNREEARQIVFEWIDRFPRDKLARFQLGYLYASQFLMYDEAIFQFKRAIDLDPGYGLAYNYLGYTYGFKEMKQEALEAMKKYVSLVPDLPNPYDSLGEIYMNLIRDYDQAEAYFQKAYSLKPDFAPHKFAEVCQLKGMYRRARILLESNLFQKCFLSEGAKYFLLGRLHFELDEYDLALDNIQQGLSDRPVFHRLYWLSGLINVKKGLLEKAEKDLTKLAELDSNSICYYHLLGHYYLARGEYGEAIKALEKPVRIIHGIPFNYLDHCEYYHQNLAEAYFQKGDLNTAETICLEILTENPNWAPVLFLLGQIYEKMGTKQKASGAYQRFLNVWQSADRDHPQIQEALKKIEQFKRG